MGIVFGPRVNDQIPAIELEVNVRVLENDEAVVTGIDGVYLYEGASLTTFLDDVYPDVISQFEDAFEDAQLQYYYP